MTPPWLWALFTLIAAGGQSLRNALQHDLTARIGASGATFVRFLFGLPFALVFLALACIAAGEEPPAPTPAGVALTLFGCAAQVLGTGLMLLAMRRRSFVVATALNKTEAIQITLVGLVLAPTRANSALLFGVALATAGVLLISAPAAARLAHGEPNRSAALEGLGSAAAFGVATVSYREGILWLGAQSFLVGAATQLALTLVAQTIFILLWLMAVDRPTLRAVARAWRGSLLAGGVGASATLVWFFALALQEAALVRTLSLVEVVFAQVLTRHMFRQSTTGAEKLAMAMIAAGVALALNFA